MRKKTVLKSELREKHARTRSSVKIKVAPQPKQTVIKEEPIEVEEEPVVKKNTRKTRAPKNEMPVAVEEKAEETAENNE